ncbi:putative EPIDERMAL PATTERNING FACTOR-like protein [Helianthus annuus]|nr:putative EPIDERMAL PATTERNING FACTOR-like protein [Helianthus annuus]
MSNLGFDLMKNEDERYGRGIENRIGSRPPSCEHKCFGCSPCQPTQVPTISLHYTNYEPEGWKCKCGPSFYSP